MGWVMVIVLVATQVAIIALLLPHTTAALGGLSFLEPTCEGVECGRGRCTVTPAVGLGHICECESGWSQLLRDDRLRFLPCVIPNCILNYTCYQDPTPPETPSLHELSSQTILDPCLWSYCGEGECMKASSGFGYRCECKEGFENLLNISNLPCFRDCVVGADCLDLGFPLFEPYFPSSPPYFPDRGASSPPEKLMWWLILAVTLAVIRAPEMEFLSGSIIIA